MNISKLGRKHFFIAMAAILSLGAAVAAVAGSAGGAGLVSVCHQPGTGAARVLILPEAAVAGHLGHGDFLMGGSSSSAAYSGGSGFCE